MCERGRGSESACEMKMRGPVAARRRPWRFVREAEESEGGQRKERERGIKYTSVEPLVFPRWTKRGRGGQREIGILNGPINGGGTHWLLRVYESPT